MIYTLFLNFILITSFVFVVPSFGQPSCKMETDRTGSLSYECEFTPISLKAPPEDATIYSAQASVGSFPHDQVRVAILVRSKRSFINNSSKANIVFDGGKNGDMRGVDVVNLGKTNSSNSFTEQLIAVTISLKRTMSISKSSFFWFEIQGAVFDLSPLIDQATLVYHNYPK